MISSRSQSINNKMGHKAIFHIIFSINTRTEDVISAPLLSALKMKSIITTALAPTRIASLFVLKNVTIWSTTVMTSI